MDQNVNLENNVDTLFHSLENFTQKEGIIGKPVSQADKTFMPVVSLTLGYGSGNTASKNQKNAQMSTSDNTSGGALGLGARLTTEAVIVIDNNNSDVSLLPLNTSGNVSKLIDKIPQIMTGFNNNSNSQTQL